MVPAEYVRERLVYDKLTGLLFWRKAPRGRRRPDNRAGTLNKKNGYLYIRLIGKNLLMHRVIWLYVTGEWPENDIDHDDGVRTHNWWTNLKKATRGQNHQNRTLDAKNTSGFPGVSRRKDTGRWCATICVDKNRIHLGCFDTPEEAHQVYLKAKAELHSYHPTVRGF